MLIMPFARYRATLRTVLAGAVFGFLPPSRAAAQDDVHHPDSTPPRVARFRGTVAVPLATSGMNVSTIPVVEVMINGRGPYRMGVETGANFVGITASLADSAGLRRAGGSGDESEYMVDSLKLGGATFEHFTVTALPRAPRGVDGILGLSFFRNVVLTIDYPKRQLRLSKDSLAAANGQDVLGLTRVGPFWALPMSVGGRSYTAVIDTRSSTALSFRPQQATALPFESEPRVTGRAGGAGLPDSEIKAGRLTGDVTIGGYRITRPTVVLHELPPHFPQHPLVGTMVLSEFVVSLDQQRARVRLTRGGPRTFALSEAAPRPRPDQAPAAAADAPAGKLADYAGRYGVRTIKVVDGRLVLQRDGGPALDMVALGGDAFGLSGVPEARIEFTRDASGRVTKIRVRGMDGQWSESAREPGPT